MIYSEPLPSEVASCAATPTDDAQWKWDEKDWIVSEMHIPHKYAIDVDIHTWAPDHVIIAALIPMLMLPLLASKLGLLGSSTLVYSLLGMFYFGIDHFLISYSNEIHNNPGTWLDPRGHMMMMFLLSGLYGLVLSRTSLYSHSALCAKPRGTIWLVASGVAVVCAQVASQQTFRTNIVNAGPLHAMVEQSLLVVTLFFLFYNNERPNPRQLLSIIIVCCASFVIASKAHI